MAFTDTREAVTAIFIGYYDRAPAPNGLNYWVADIDENGFTVADVARAFAVQQESQDLYPGLTTAGSGDLDADVAFVTAIFQNLFGRDPNNLDVDGGLGNHWVNALQNGADVGQLIIDIISGAQGDDLAIIENKIEVGLAYADAAEAAGVLTRDPAGDTVLDDVTGDQATVDAALAEIDETFEPVGVPGETFILSAGEGRDNLQGTGGNDTFEAFNTELQDGDRMDGGSGTDTLTFLNSEEGPVIAPITTSVEQVVVTNQVNDLNGQADNNVGGYSTNIGDLLNGSGNLPLDLTINVDTEIDGGMMSGVTRWEDYDSRADLVIEDARDQDDTDGTFTGDITVAMVSTDPGNVDFAVYFDEPVNTSKDFGTLVLNVLDQEAAFGLPAPTASSTGYLTESSLIEFSFAYDGQPITVELPDELGVTYGPDVSFQDLLDQVEAATQQALIDAGVTDNLGFTASLGEAVSVGVGNQFTLPLILTFDDVPADTIQASSDDIIVLGRDSGNNGATPSTDTFGSLSTERLTDEELIRLNVELDDVGKGSMGGDAMFGAMSTGRQSRDDGTSDSIGIQQFDIEVDRSSQLQTINSTNNSLEVVNIASGENDGPNNTTTAVDEMAGDLVVRGQANPFNLLGLSDVSGGALPDLLGISTDGPMPGAVPQHNSFGFSDVRVINAAGMTGVQNTDESGTANIASVDLTAELTEEIVEKYLDIQDSQADGNDDDVLFDYDMGAGDDEFLLNMSADALNAAGTGSREDFRLDIDGNDGDDVLTTNIGGSGVDFFGTDAGTDQLGAIKLIDEQGQDYYILDSNNGEGWYTNAVFNSAAEFSIDGGEGNDVIWTHGWGDFAISDGDGMDVVYTDNSGVVQISDQLGSNIDRNLTEHDQIDYVVGAVWAFNAENIAFQGDALVASGGTNDWITLGNIGDDDATRGFAEVTVRYKGANGDEDTFYDVTVEIPFSSLDVTSSGDVRVREQELNQAVKEAVNGDAILSNLLEAADGPGNSLIVYSKTDGDHVAADFGLAFTALSINGDPVALDTDLIGGVPTGYATDDGNFVNIGSASDVESDNTITVAADGDMDVFVLSTSDESDDQPELNGGFEDGNATDLNGASNEVLEITVGNFGRDTVLNFDAGDDDDEVDGAEDVFDFLAIDFEATADEFVNNEGTDDNSEAENSISILVEDADNDTAAEVGELYDDLGAGEQAILIVVDQDDDNTGTVYLMTGQGDGEDDASVFEHGEISLIGTEWSSLNADNFA